MWRGFARQLSNPSGMAGIAIGALMKVANREPTRLAVAALDIRSGHDVLDLGCGPGQAVSAMLCCAAPGTVTGIDQSPTMIAQANAGNRRAVASGQAAFVKGGFDALPFADKSFDRVLASNVMYFWHETGPVVRELRRVLRPGGKLAIYLTCSETMRHWKIANAGLHRLFDAEQVRFALTDAGFAPDHVSVEKIELRGGVCGLVATGAMEQESMAN